VDRPRPVLCLFPLRWPLLAGCRGGAHVGGVRSSRSHPRFGDRLQAHARRRASHGVLLALERSSRASVRAALRRHDRPMVESICFGDAGPEPAELRASAASRGCYNPRRSAARPARVGRVDRAPPALAGCGVVYHRPVRSARLAHDSWQRPAPQATQRLPPPPSGRGLPPADS
jgi:hypothetical protein